MRRRLLVAAMVTTTLAAGGCGTLDTMQRQAIFQPGQEQGRWHREPPAGTEQFDLELPNAQRVHAWFMASSRGAQAPTVLYLHGRRWNLNNNLFRLDRWRALDVNLLAIDYRGFGRSTSLLPSQDSAREDIGAALDELVRRQPDAGRRFVYGHSLGGALAISAMTGPQVPAVAGLIVESTFTSIPDIVRANGYGWLPGIDLLVTMPLPSVEHIARLRTPLLVIHGGADQVVPVSMSDRLYAAARLVPPGHKRLLQIAGGTHSSASRVDPQAYEAAIRSFMTDAAELAGAPTTTAPQPAAATAVTAGRMPDPAVSLD